MKIKIAKHIGFCFGVRRAVNMAEHALEKKGNFSCLGAIIHNPQEVRRLSLKGLKIIDNIKYLKKNDTLIIRSHGLLPRIIESVKSKGVNLIDATCPFVKKAQNICKRLKDEGFDVVVVGEREHPEVRSILGFVDGKAAVVESLFDVKRLKLRSGKIGILAQTTQSKENFHDLVTALLKKYNSGPSYNEIRIFNTICKDSATRQQAAKKISSVCDVILVIGGKNSANSRRLAKICKSALMRAYHVETEDDLKPGWFKNIDRVGIISGASTPDWIIKKIAKALKNRNGEE